MNNAKKVIRNTGFLYAKMAITMFISLYSTRLILNALGNEDFGIFSIIGGAIAMLGFLNATMASATQRFMSYAEGENNDLKQKKIFNISLVLHFIIGIIIGLFLILIGYFLFNGILNIPNNRLFAAKVVYFSLIISTVITVMSVPYEAVLNAKQNMLYYSIVGVVESFLKLVIAFIVANALGDKLILYGVLMACIPLLVMLILRIYCHQKYDECIISPWRFWDKGLLKSMTFYASWDILGTSSSMFSQYGQGIVMNHFFGAKINTSQGIASQLSGQLGVFSTTIMKAINPLITKSEGEGNRGKMINMVFVACRYSFFLRLITYMPFYFLMDEIFNIWLVETPPYAIVFLRLLLIRELIEYLFLPLNSAISAVGTIKKYKIFTSIVNIFPIILGSVLFYFGYPPEYIYYVFIFLMLIKSAITVMFFIKLCHSTFLEMTLNVFNPLLKVCLFAICFSCLTNVIFRGTNYGPYLVAVISTFSLLFAIYKFGMKDNERDFLKSIIFKYSQKFF